MADEKEVRVVTLTIQKVGKGKKGWEVDAKVKEFRTKFPVKFNDIPEAEALSLNADQVVRVKVERGRPKKDEPKYDSDYWWEWRGLTDEEPTPVAHGAPNASAHGSLADMVTVRQSALKAASAEQRQKLDLYIGVLAAGQNVMVKVEMPDLSTEATLALAERYVRWISGCEAPEKAADAQEVSKPYSDAPKTKERVQEKRAQRVAAQEDEFDKYARESNGKLGWTEFWQRVWAVVGATGALGLDRVGEALGGKTAAMVVESGQSLEQVLNTIQRYAKEQQWS